MALAQRLSPAFPETHMHPVVGEELEALAQQGILRTEPGDPLTYLHTGTLDFRLELASTAYRQAVEDILLYTDRPDEVRELLKTADGYLRLVKYAGTDPDRARKTRLRRRGPRHR